MAANILKLTEVLKAARFLLHARKDGTLTRAQWDRPIRAVAACTREPANTIQATATMHAKNMPRHTGGHVGVDGVVGASAGGTGVAGSGGVGCTWDIEASWRAQQEP